MKILKCLFGSVNLELVYPNSNKFFLNILKRCPKSNNKIFIKDKKEFLLLICKFLKNYIKEVRNGF